MNAFRIKQTIGGIAFIAIGLWIGRLHMSSPALQMILAFVFCGIGGVGVARGLGILPQAPNRNRLK